MDVNRLNNWMKYEFSDENLKLMYTELKEKYFKMFKDYIKFIKNIKNKEEKILNESVNNLNELTTEIVLYKGLLEKIVNIRKSKSDIRDISDIKVSLYLYKDQFKRTF